METLLNALLHRSLDLTAMQAFPTILYAFPMCCVVWTWDSLFYGASDFVYNAKAVAVASFCGVVGGSPVECVRPYFSLKISCRFRNRRPRTRVVYVLPSVMLCRIFWEIVVW